MNKNLDNLVIGDSIYLHPKSNRDLAAFGIVTKINQEYDKLTVMEPFDFKYSKAFGLWLPFYFTPFENAHIEYNDKMLKKYKLYIGQDKIKNGMSENQNPNYDLVSKVLEVLDK
jgi:hypothetical protein